MARYRLTESRLRNMIHEAVKSVLKESEISPNLEQYMEMYENDPRRFMHVLNMFQIRYESILKDAQSMGLDDIVEIAQQRLTQLSDEVVKARQKWNLH